jgi:hypothetical protein
MLPPPLKAYVYSPGSFSTVAFLEFGKCHAVTITTQDIIPPLATNPLIIC